MSRLSSRRRRPSLLRRAAPPALFLALLPGIAFAQLVERVWQGDVDQNWHDYTNWAGNDVPNSAAETAVFGIPIRHVFPYMNQAFSLGSLLYRAGAVSHTIYGGGQITLLSQYGIINNATNLQTITNPIKLGTNLTFHVQESSGNLRLTENLTSDDVLNKFRLTKTGAGTLSLADDPPNGNLPSTLSQIGALTVSGGIVHLYNQYQLFLSDANNAAIKMNGGTLRIVSSAVQGSYESSDGGNAMAEVGENAGSNAFVEIDGESGRLTLRGMVLGKAGTGTMVVKNGSEATVAVDLTLGQAAGSMGSLLVDGSGSLLSNSRGNTIIGGAGTGTLTIQNGARFSTGSYDAQKTHIGQQSGSNGTVTISGAGSRWDASRIEMASAGTATVKVLNGAQLNADHIEFLSSNAKLIVDNATVRMDSSYGNGNIEILSGGMTLLDNGYGANRINGVVSGSGRLTLGSSLTNTGGSLTLGSGSTSQVLPGVTLSQGTLTLSNVFSQQQNPRLSLTSTGTDTTSASLVLSGVNGGGKLVVTYGGILTTNTAFLGVGATSSNTVSMNQATWNLGSSLLTVGYEGSSTLTLESGSTVSSGSASIGTKAGSSGKVVVGSQYASTSTWNVADALYIGDSGGGSLSVLHNIVNSGGAIIGRETGSTGTVTFRGGYQSDSDGDLYYGSLGRWNTSSLTIGNKGKGDAYISGTVITSSGESYLGKLPGSSGSLRLENESIWDLGSNTLSVGKEGNGTLTISGDSKVAAGTILLGNSASEILVTGNSTLATTGLTNVGTAGVIRINNGRLTLNQSGNSTFGGTVTGGSLTKTGAGTITFSGAYSATGDLTINGGGIAFQTDSNKTLDNYILGQGRLSKTGAADLVLTRYNDYSGGTTLSAGRLLAGDNKAFGTGAVTINGGQIGTSGGARTLANPLALSGSFGAVGLPTFTGAASLGTNVTLTTADSATRVTFNGAISGAFGLTIAGSGIVSLNAGNTYTGATTVNAGTLFVNGSSQTSGYTLGGGVLYFADNAASSLTVGALSGTSGSAVSLGAKSLVVNQSANTEYRGIIVGTGALTKGGTGDLALYNANTYGGGTVLNAGRLLIANNSALGTGTLTINGGHIRAHETGRTLTNALALNGNFEVGQSTLFTGNATLGANVTVTMNDGGDPAVFSGVIGGGGNGITKAGAGIVTLSGNNTYTGVTSVHAGTLSVTGTSQTSGLALNGGTLDLANLNAPGLSVRSLSGTGGTVSLGAKRLLVDQGANTEYRGTITGAGGSLTKAGVGNIALYGANTFTGGTVLNAGRLLIANDAALGTGTLTINGGHIRAHESGRTLANALVLGGDFEVGQQTYFTGSATLGRDVTVTAPDVNNGVSELRGAISGNGFGLTKSGAGVLTLSGSNTYTGATAVTAGTLTVTGTSATSGYSVAQGATLDMGGFGIPSGKSLAVNGTLQNMGSSAFTVANGATLSGSGTVPVSVNNTSGIVAPGNSPGTLTIDGNYTQGASGVLNIEIVSPASFDVLAITGTATLGGTLNVTFLPGFSAASFPASFNFLTAGGGISGFFNAVNFTNLPAGTTTRFDTLSGSGAARTLSLVVVPEANAGLLALIAAPLLTLAVPRKRKGKERA